MKKNDINLAKQYNNFNESFSTSVASDNNISRQAFYQSLNFNFDRKVLLDLACGDGQDLKEYQKRGAKCFGIDSSKKLIETAIDFNPAVECVVGDMRNLPYKNESFDIVVSKYAIGTVENLDEVFIEVSRVLKSGGVFAYLTTHPMRLFMEQKESTRDYFMQKNVSLNVFGGKFTIIEPSHTFNEFFSPKYLERFNVSLFSEHYDPQSADFPGREIYPDFFILVANKK